jgi:hypothetical protein
MLANRSYPSTAVSRTPTDYSIHGCSARQIQGHQADQSDQETPHPTASYKCHASKNTSFVKIAEMGLEAMLQFISVDAYSRLRKE